MSLWRERIYALGQLPGNALKSALARYEEQLEKWQSNRVCRYGFNFYPATPPSPLSLQEQSPSPFRQGKAAVQQNSWGGKTSHHLPTTVAGYFATQQVPGCLVRLPTMEGSTPPRKPRVCMECPWYAGKSYSPMSKYRNSTSVRCWKHCVARRAVP